MITRQEALAHIGSVPAIQETETLPLEECVGRILAEDVAARLTHPPAAMSAMDGYAVRFAEALSNGPLALIERPPQARPLMALSLPANVCGSSPARLSRADVTMSSFRKMSGGRTPQSGSMCPRYRRATSGKRGSIFTQGKCFLKQVPGSGQLTSLFVRPPIMHT